MFELVDNLIIELTRRCNLSCSYCYLKGTVDDQGIDLMSLDTYRALLDRVVRDRKSKNDLRVTFHGGETLTIGNEAFEKYLSILKTDLIERVGYRVRTNLQTNGTLIDDDTVALFKKYGVVPSISYNGSLDTDLTRCGSTHRVIEAFRRLDRAEVQYGIIGVLDKNNVDRHAQLVSELDRRKYCNSFKLNRVVDVEGGCPVGATVDEYFCNHFVASSDDLLSHRVDKIEHGVYQCLKRFYRHEILGEKRSEQGICGLEICGSGVHVIAVAPDGEVLPCARYCDHTYSLGSVLNSDLLGLGKMRTLVRLTSDRIRFYSSKNCSCCRYSSICTHTCYALYRNGRESFREVCCLMGLIYEYCEHERSRIEGYFSDTREDNSASIR